jgi:hypothetical protein
MRLVYPTFLVLLLLGAGPAMAQTTLNFTISQISPLFVKAGNDTVVKTGEKIRIGASISASGGSGIYKYSWTPVSDLDNPNAANPIATVDSTITYTLLVNDSLTGCSQMSTITITLAGEINVHIFPSPNTGSFYITTQGDIGDPEVDLQIFDMLGRIVHGEILDGSSRLNKAVRLFPKTKGVYIVRLYSKNINLIKKIIVE